MWKSMPACECPGTSVPDVLTVTGADLLCRCELREEEPWSCSLPPSEGRDVTGRLSQPLRAPCPLLAEPPMARGACAPDCLRAWTGKEAFHVCTWGPGAWCWAAIEEADLGEKGARGDQSAGRSQGPGWSCASEWAASCLSL